MIKAVLLDLAGVVYVGASALPGAEDALARLRDAGLAIRFLTNTTRSPRREILAALEGMGIACGEDELFTPAKAACAMLTQRHLTAHLLVHPALREDFAGISGGNETAVVVGDAGEDFTYASLNAAFRALAGGAQLLALANNRTFRDSDGELSLDTGAFVAALEFASRASATVLGKPSPDFFHAALASTGCEAGEAVMVGDDVEADVAGALAAGIGAGLLVRTGKYVAGAEDVVEPRPTAVVDDLAAAADWILADR